MRYEAALGMNLLLHLQETKKTKATYSDVFSTYQAKEIYRHIRLFMSHYQGVSHTAIIYINNHYDNDYNIYPFQFKNCYNFGKCAVVYNGKMYLFYVYNGKSDISKTEYDLRKLSGLGLEKYSLDGETVTYVTCDVTFMNKSILQVLGWDVDGDIKSNRKISSITAKDLDSRLFPYQVEGVRMLDEGFRLLADEPGLGKTAQVLQYIQVTGIRNILICCPATLKLNWKKEILMWTKTTEDKITVISSTQSYPVKNRYIIINYDLLPYWAHQLSQQKFELVVCDECHYIQSSTAKRTQAFLQIAQNIEDRIFVSGTPFTSRPFQMYTALHMIAPKIFSSEQDYGARFCQPVYKHNTVTYNGAANMQLLHDILSDGICIHRRKEDVLTELPDKLRVPLPVGLAPNEIKGSPVYEAIKDLEQRILKTKDPLATMEFQRQIAYLRKRDAVVSWIKDFLETDKKLVVFGVHKEALDAVERAFPNISVRIDGSTPNEQRIKNVELFQTNDNIRLFIGNVKAAGTGITLTAASDTVFIEFEWTASTMLQAEDRIHRIGAKNACMIYYMTVPGTIDERILAIINRKALIHSKIFDESADNMFAELKLGQDEYQPLTINRAVNNF